MKCSEGAINIDVVEIASIHVCYPHTLHTSLGRKHELLLFDGVLNPDKPDG